MEKLELKHLAPYLPYRLNMLYDFDMGDVWTLDITNINAITEFDKPILRPLSDLFNLIDWDNNNDPYMIGYKYRIEKVKEDRVEFYANEYDADYASSPKFYIDITSFDWWLFEKHFDVFGLIEKGLAIDKNKLAKTK